MKRANFLRGVSGALPVLACIGALHLPAYFTFLATSAAITALVVQSLGLLVGYAGLISLAQMAFCAVGAWVTFWVNINFPDIPYLAQLAVGVIAAVAISLVIGLPALRLRGINLAAVSLAFALATNVVLNVNGFPGEAEVITFQRPDWLANDHHLLILSIVALTLTSVGIWAIRQYRVGAAWSAVRFSEKATAALGVSVAGTKLSAFAVSAGIAGLAGGLMATQLGTLSATNFMPLSSVVIFALTVALGGEYVEGAILAGVLSVAVPELLRRFGLPVDLDSLLFGIGAIDGLRRGKSAGAAFRGLFSKRRMMLPGKLSNAAGPSASQPTGAPIGADMALAIDGLTVHFGEVIALENVSFNIPDGAVIALIGPNGAGKSTLVDAVTGFIDRHRGGVSCQGRTLTALTAHRRAQMGVRRTFQQGRAIPELTIEQYVRLASRRRFTTDELRAILTFLRCPGEKTLIATVDVGLRRLVEIAAAVAARPRILLLDEPAAGLSRPEAVLLGQRISEIPRRFGCSVLLIEHDMDLVEAACDAVVVLDFGRVIAQGNAVDVLRRPEVVAAYLGTATS
jgi:branched-chain amino acid transport system ATP-binding protein/branched-chain amino acid transport system permease protein